MSGIFRVTRRDFLRDIGVGTGALVFGSYFSPDELFAADVGKLKELLHNHVTLNAFVAIQPLDGTIVISWPTTSRSRTAGSSATAV